MPSIKREAIPLYQQLEKVGKKSYGLYLLNLIVLSLVLIMIGAIAPGLFGLEFLLHPILFAAALFIPLIIMDMVARSPLRLTYHYLFG